MIDWDIVAKVAGGGFGVTILVLIILSLLAWIMGLLIQRFQAKGEEVSTEKKE